MDNNSLDMLLNNSCQKQYWLKPIGWPQDHPYWDFIEDRIWTKDQIQIDFSDNPVQIAVSGVVFVYRINCSKLCFVAERLPRAEWTEKEPRSAEQLRRWPHYIKARNLTPEFGRVWKQHDLQPFPLAREYNELRPEDCVTLGKIQFGGDKVQIPQEFAEFLMRRICDVK
jgi:hypothetical protein